MDPKTYLWFSLLFLAAYVFAVHHFEPVADNVYYRLYRLPSGGIGAFGPLIIQGFGFDSVSWRIALSVVRDYSFYRVVPEYLVQHAIRRIINRGYPRLCLAHQQDPSPVPSHCPPLLLPNCWVYCTTKAWSQCRRSWRPTCCILCAIRHGWTSANALCVGATERWRSYEEGDDDCDLLHCSMCRECCRSSGISTLNET